MFSRFMGASFQLVARRGVRNGNGKKQDGKDNHQQIHGCFSLELHHDREYHSRFVVAQVGTESRASYYTDKARCRRQEWSWHE
jgi:hypothetical protein